MGFAQIKAFVALQLFLFFLQSCFTVSAAQVDLVSLRKVHPPVMPPIVSPAPTPTPTPTHTPAPSRAPSPYHLPTRALVAVQGVVYCKSCKYPRVDTLLGASPLSGAIVKLQCNNTKYPLNQEATTDKNGYFFLKAQKKVTTYGVHKCKMFLVSSPSASCKKPTNLHYGLKGALLRYQKPKDQVSFALYTVGPFAFAPKCPL